MRIWLLALAACGDGEPFDAGASISVDGALVELPTVTCDKIDTFFQLTATAADGSVLAIGFPTDTPVGARTCMDGRVVGEITVDFTDAGGIKFASYYPLAGPENGCTFDLIATGGQIELAALAGSLPSEDGIDHLELVDGEFRALVR